MIEVNKSAEETRALIMDAYELEHAKGSELLLQLGHFDLWRGDLAAMRDDPGGAGKVADSSSAGAERFRTVYALSKAFAHLPDRCGETLHLYYVQGCNEAEVAVKLDTTNLYAGKLIHDCTQRLFEVARSVEAVSENALASSRHR